MPRHYLTLPDLAAGDRPVIVSLWLVNRGSRVVEGDQLIEILAGEAVIDLPSPATGRLVKKLVAEREPVHTGQRLAVIELDEEEPGDDGV